MITSQASNAASHGGTLVLSSTQSVIYWFCCGFARLIMLAALLAAPWPFASVSTTSQFYLFSAVALSLAIWLPGALWQSLIRGLDTTRIPMMILPLVGGAGLLAYQLSVAQPVTSSETIQRNFEETVATSNDERQKRELGKTSLIRSLQEFHSICFASTRLELVKLVAVITAFFLGTQLFSSQKPQLWLWAALALNGSALTFFGICQELSWNGKLFWVVPLRYGGFPFASFVNRNNAAGYLLICLSAAIGLMSWTSMSPLDMIRGTDRRLSRKLERVRHSHSSPFDPLSYLSRLTGEQVVAVTAVVLITAGIVIAASRGGWLALGCTAILTGAIASRSRKLSVLAFFAFIGLGIVILVSWIGVGDRLHKRWDDFASVDAIAKDGRWGHWCDSIHAIADFPLFGTGLGTYRYAYLPYQTHFSTSHLRFFNADNQFLEWWVEGGFVGLGLVVLSILFALGTISTLLRRLPYDPVGLVGFFLLSSQIVSALFDYGSTMPSNAITLAAMFGSITGRAAQLVRLGQLQSKSNGYSFPPLFPSVLIPILGTAILAGLLFQLPEVKAAAAAHRISRFLPNLDSKDSLDEEKTSLLIDQLSKAAVDYPHDPEVQIAIADLLIYRFRLQEFRIAEAGSSLKPLEIWLQTHPSFFYQQVNLWARSGQFERIAMLVESPTVQQNLVPAFAHLLQAQANCELIPGAARLLALIGFVQEKKDNYGSEGQLRRELVSDPASAQSFYEIGLYADFAGLVELSYACWKSSLERDSRFLRDIHLVLSRTLSLKEEMALVIPPSGELLLRLARSMPATEQESQRRELALNALELLKDLPGTVNDPDRAHLRAVAHDMLSEYDEAMKEYRHALEGAPLRADWRIELIDLLLRHKGSLWALKEAETCAALAPDDRRIQDLVRKLQSMVDRR